MQENEGYTLKEHLSTSMNKNTDLFKAIRSLRRSAPTVANTIDGKNKDIPDHFAGIYESLYNSVDDNQELIGLQHTLNTKINVSCMNEVTKVTSPVIADAVAQIKQDKTDPIFNFSSDCFKNAPGIPYDQLAAKFRGFFITRSYQFCYIACYFGTNREG